MVMKFNSDGLRDDEMGHTCSKHGMRNSFGNFDLKPEGNSLFERPRSSWEVDTN
jgi:hypothetical protein